MIENYMIGLLGFVVILLVIVIIMINRDKKDTEKLNDELRVMNTEAIDHWHDALDGWDKTIELNDKINCLNAQLIEHIKTLEDQINKK